MLWKFIISYIDDILIYSPSLHSHIFHVKQVLSHLREHHLYVKADKCEFHMATISFLEYIVSQEEVVMDANKEAAVNNWPTLTTVKEHQCFLDFANFYWQFIWGFSSIITILIGLLKKGSEHLKWTQAAEEAISKLKICHHLDFWSLNTWTSSSFSLWK